MMFDNLRNPLAGLESAGDMVVDRIKKAADSAAQAAKNTTSQLEGWAKDGYGSARGVVKTKPLMLGAASLGFGALMGGLYALWQRGAAKSRTARKTLPVRARAKQSLRAMTNGARPATKRKPKTSRRALPSTNA
jgi:hypothetical protein